MSDAELSRSFTRETKRAKPVRGGKTTCCKPGCTEAHSPGSGYCMMHHAEYMRGWRRKRAELFNDLLRARSRSEGVET